MHRQAEQSYIVIELGARRLSLYQGVALRYRFPIAVGAPQTPTPAGNWYLVNKKRLPESGPFGTRWLGLNRPGYGIHGTNAPDSIGRAVSLGCVRLHNGDIEQLYDAVAIGTPVIITP